MLVLLEPAVTHLGEAEDALDDPDGMLDFRPHFGFGAVLGALGFVDDAAVAIAAVDEVPRPRRLAADHRALAAIGLVAPDAGLVAVQQLRQHRTVGDIGRRRSRRFGSAWCGCRRRNAPSCRNTTGCPSSSDAF